ncbi:MAG: hypothetical protein IKG89_03490 [Oscillospiraceae bacterium]|nr:hypothetical protein [Oscillospiraceae bacterium]
MLKLLLKKQLSEVFKSYFYDAKKNRMRSKGAVIAWFLFFFVVMVGVLGGMFTALSLSLCGSLVGAGMGWLYFLLMSGIAIVLGAFGSVFSTYSGLYLSKDNDQLLSLPIPVRTIISARLVNVYLMGTLYSAVVLLPMLIVYWIVAGAAAAKVICGLLLFLIVSFIVLILSCLLGWVVARISLRLKNKSFITVLAALVFIALYYFVYFRASSLIQDMLQNVAIYGARIKGAAYGLYLFGRIGEGDWLWAVVFTAVTAAVFALVWIVLTRSFLKIATMGGKTGKVIYREKTTKVKSPARALLGKELARFTSSPNYMLNCGIGVLFIPACGVLLLIKGREILGLLGTVFAARPGTAAVLVCTVLCILSSMNTMAAPSVSLEGKSLWIPQSLPVEPKTVLRSKAALQLLFTLLPMIFAALCGAAVLEASPALRLLCVLTPLVYSAFFAVFGTAVGVRLPLLNWTNELAPIKQSAAVGIVLFGSWALSVALAGLYLLIGWRIGAGVYLLLWIVLLAAAGAFFLRWLDTKGAKLFRTL